LSFFFYLEIVEVETETCDMTFPWAMEVEALGKTFTLS